MAISENDMEAILAAVKSTWRESVLDDLSVRIEEGYPRWVSENQLITLRAAVWNQSEQMVRSRRKTLIKQLPELFSIWPPPTPRQLRLFT